MSQDKVFTPFEWKGRVLRNRLGVAPMTRMSSQKDSVPRADVLEFLVRRARGGASLVYTEAIVTDYESAQGYPGQARLLTQRQIDAWKPVTAALREAGALAIAQVFHCGRMAWPEINPAGRSIAPSAVTPEQDNPLTGKPYPVPDAMSAFDIDHVVAGFVETAAGAAAAGFDGLEVHCAHGYLLNQFLSSYSNRREDDYGGSLENRFRIVRRVLRAVRERLPEPMLLVARLSNWGIADMHVSLFSSKEEWQSLVRLFAEEPIDALSVSTYRAGDEAFGSGKTMAALTREATDLPLMICGKVHDRASAEAAVREADLVLSGKTALLDPDWVEGIRQGRPMRAYASEEANVAYTEEPLP